MFAGFQTALNAVYPARCLACGDVVDSDFGLCGPCWRDTSFIGGLVCDACGAPIPGEDTMDHPMCDACIGVPRPWVKGRAAVLYRDTGRRLVLALKHGDRQEVAHPAGLWMAPVVQTLISEHTLIAPVPLHWSRMIKRRYNQSALLAKALAKRVYRPTAPDLLVRTRKTRSLDGMGRAERTAMLRGAIQVHARWRGAIVGRPILLVDDVLTSGATLTVCAQACLDAGSGPVCVVALARVAKDA